jgi:hypothetical protein
LQKSFWGDDRNFSGPLMRFTRGDMRDQIVSCKNDHGASYRRYGVLQYGVGKKSTFARFPASFDFRLLQQYLPIAEVRRSLAARASSRSLAGVCGTVRTAPFGPIEFHTDAGTLGRRG